MANPRLQKMKAKLEASERLIAEPETIAAALAKLESDVSDADSTAQDLQWQLAALTAGA